MICASKTSDFWAHSVHWQPVFSRAHTKRIVLHRLTSVGIVLHCVVLHRFVLLCFVLFCFALLILLRRVPFRLAALFFPSFQLISSFSSSNIVLTGFVSVVSTRLRSIFLSFCRFSPFQQRFYLLRHVFRKKAIRRQNVSCETFGLCPYSSPNFPLSSRFPYVLNHILAVLVSFGALWQYIGSVLA